MNTKNLTMAVVFGLAFISLLIVWNSDTAFENDLTVLTFLVVINIAMNAFWNFLFYKLRMPGYAVIQSAALAISVVAIIFYIQPISKFAGILLLPYLAWSISAVYISYTNWNGKKKTI